MKRYYYPIIILFFGFSACKQVNNQYSYRKGNLFYDFSFAELAIKYIETVDSTLLIKIVDLKATDHIWNHAKNFNSNIPNDSKLTLIKYLLSPCSNKTKILPKVKSNLLYAKEFIVKNDLPQTECLKYLPDSFNYTSNLFFTFSYDIGVVFGENASINLAHPNFIKDANEIKYYSIHELHHAGFVSIKKNIMPFLDISTYKEMAKLIEYYTHLEGMGTYAAFDIRLKENAMHIDSDYIAIQDTALTEMYKKEFFEIYFHFKLNPDSLLNDKDWEKLSTLSDKKRLWYRVGASMAKEIDKRLGRNKLVNLIAEPSENFINAYLLSCIN